MIGSRRSLGTAAALLATAPRAAAAPRITRTLLTAAILAMFGGCASDGGTPLQQAQRSVARELMVQCYWHNEGKRLVFGGYAVHSACRRWADDVVRVRLPPDRPWGNDGG